MLLDHFTKGWLLTPSSCLSPLVWDRPYGSVTMNVPSLLDEHENVCLLRLAKLNILYLNYYYFLAFLLLFLGSILMVLLCVHCVCRQYFSYFFSVLKICQATLPSCAYTGRRIRFASCQLHLLFARHPYQGRSRLIVTYFYGKVKFYWATNKDKMFYIYSVLNPQRVLPF